MGIKFDLKDKKILYLLFENARMPMSEIAKRVGLSKNAVRYRMDRFVKNKVIWKYFPILDAHKYGVYSYDLFINLKATKKQEQEIKDYFRKHPNVVWATSLFGKWDLFVQILSKNVNDFEEVLDKILIHLGNKVASYDAKLRVQRLKISHQLFDYEMNYKFTPAKPDYSKVYKLDKLDKKILSYLNNKDALAPYAVIAHSVGSTLETVRNRMKRMVKEGVIVRYYPFVNHEKFDAVRYLVMVNFRYLTKEVEGKIAEYIRNVKGVNLVFKTIGRPEMYFWVVTQHPSKVEEIMKNLENKFFEYIVNMDPMLTTEELTLNFFPKAMEKL